MSGVVIRVAPKNSYILTPFAAGATNTMQIILARRVAAARYQNGVFVLRLHTASSFVAGHTASIGYFADGYTDDDPGITNWSQPANQIITPANLAMVGGTDGAAMVHFSAMTSPFPPLLGITLLLSSTVVTALKVELSCDLNLKGE
jgi:hypothetical protein